MKSQSTITLLRILLLFITVVRLGGLDSKPFRSYRLNRSERSLVPDTGSFVGIDENGYEQEADIDDNGHLLVFVIHHQNASSEVQYWNSVVQSHSLNRQTSAGSIEYWGICDAGTACRAYAQGAQFSILGYIDPWEMHAVSQADARNEALLYNEHNILPAGIPRSQDPSREAQLIAKEAKSK